MGTQWSGSTFHTETVYKNVHFAKIEADLRAPTGIFFRAVNPRGQRLSVEQLSASHVESARSAETDRERARADRSTSSPCRRPSKRPGAKRNDARSFLPRARPAPLEIWAWVLAASVTAAMRARAIRTRATPPGSECARCRRQMRSAAWRAREVLSGWMAASKSVAGARERMW